MDNQQPTRSHPGGSYYLPHPTAPQYLSLSACPSSPAPTDICSVVHKLPTDPALFCKLLPLTFLSSLLYSLSLSLELFSNFSTPFSPSHSLNLLLLVYFNISSILFRLFQSARIAFLSLLCSFSRAPQPPSILFIFRFSDGLTSNRTHLKTGTFLYH